MATILDSRQVEERLEQEMIGSAANDTLKSIIPKIDAELAKLMEDRNILLAGGGTITTNGPGTSVSFSAALELHVNSLVSGAAPSVIDLTDATRAFTDDGNMLYAVIDRVAGTAVITADSATLPAVTAANQEVVLIAKRVGTSIYFRNGLGVPAGSSSTLDSSGDVTGPASATDEAIARYDGTTGKLIQNSVVTITDAGIAAGLTGLTSSGTVTASGTLAATGSITESFSSDAATTGANAEIASPSTPVVRLTNSSLTSVDQLASPVAGRVVTIVNASGNPITFNNDTGGTAANRILTGTKAPLTLSDEASIIVKYDATESRWMVVGGTGSGSGAGSDCIFSLDGSDIALWTTGDNATFLGAGALSGTFVADTTTPLQGLSSYLYTQAAGSLDDYLASPSQPVDLRFRGQEVTLSFPYTYNGANNDIEVLLYDVTNAAIIPSSTFIQNSAGVSIFKANFTIPLTCTGIRVGFHVKTLSSGSIFEFDSVKLCSDSTAYADIANITDWQPSTPSFSAGLGTVTGIEVYYRRVGQNLEVSGKAVSGTVAASIASLTLPQGLVIGQVPEITSGSYARLGDWNRNSTDGSTYDRQIIGEVGASIVYPTKQDGTRNPFVPQNGNIIIGSSSEFGFNFSVPIEGWTASNRNILTAPETFSTDTAPLTYANAATYTLSTLANAPVGTYITFTYAASTNTRTQTTGTNRPTQTDADMNQNGIRIFTRAFNVASTSGNPAVFAIQIGKGLKGVSTNLYKSIGKVIAGSLDKTIHPVSASGEFGLAYKDYNENTGILVLDAGNNTNGASTTYRLEFVDGSEQTNGYLTINAGKTPSLVAVPTPLVAYLKDVKASGTAGGTFTSGAWQTRTLNTVEGDGSIVSLSGNQFTLGPGKWEIEASAPGYAVNMHKAKLLNVTTASDAILGTSEKLDTTANQSRSIINGTLNLTSSTVFEVQHRCGTTKSTDGFGFPSASGVNEVYTLLKITKIS